MRIVQSQPLLYLVDIIISIVEFLIGLRIFLKLMGASAQAPFVQWVYETSEPLLRPFSGMFPSPQITSGFVLEFSALFALFVYAFIGYLVVELISHITVTSHRHVVVDRERSVRVKKS